MNEFSYEKAYTEIFHLGNVRVYFGKDDVNVKGIDYPHDKNSDKLIAIYYGYWTFAILWD